MVIFVCFCIYCWIRYFGGALEHMRTTTPGGSVFLQGIGCRCPRCRQAKLFQGFLQLQAQCPNCGLNLRNAENGDGAAFFSIFIIGAVVACLAWLLEEIASPALWVHYVVWFPVIIVMALGLLRPAKSVLIAYQYRYHPQAFDDEVSS